MNEAVDPIAGISKVRELVERDLSDSTLPNGIVERALTDFFDNHKTANDYYTVQPLYVRQPGLFRIPS